MPVVETTVDVIEHHTLYCDDGKVIFNQLVFWDWQDEFSRFSVAAWRLWTPSKAIHWAEPRNGTLLFMDGADLRRVRYGARRRSHTQGFDVEMEDRSILPVENRRGLGVLPIDQRKDLSR